MHETTHHDQSSPPSPGRRAAAFACAACGADLEFAPGTRALACPHCGSANEIPQEPEPSIREIDLEATLRDLEGAHERIERTVVHCDSCGADSQLPENTAADRCPFCGSGIVATRHTGALLKPESLVPFVITHTLARERFAKWLRGLWFAPNDLKHFATLDDAGAGSKARGSGMQGMYLPFWTYDAQATTTYSGQRGDHYYVTVRRGNQTVRERRTRWSPRSGTVHDRFDDVLVPASSSVPPEKAARPETWKLEALVPYDDRYLSGFRAESYSVNVRDGFAAARSIMEKRIVLTIRRDIGGDDQRIISMHPRFAAVTFKHILLPLWVSAYRYRGKSYRFIVNGQTGDVAGDRPYSIWKILAATIAVVAALLIIVLLLRR